LYKIIIFLKYDKSYRNSKINQACQYEAESINGRIDFILKRGSTIIRPIYKGIFERHDKLNSDLQNETIFIIFEPWHLVPCTGFVKETLRWYDQYLEPVK